MTALSLPEGTRLGPYEIVSPIGAGGMGEVYRAHDARLRRDVAVKVLPGQFSSDPERLRRLRQEAQAAGALNHPNILTIYDIGTQENISYIVSELLEGETLRAQLAAGPIASPKAVHQALQIAHGLDAAHARGIVHRDLKPENIFVTREGRLKILDFGLAKQTEPAAGGPAQTSAPTLQPGTNPGVVLGTLGYMSPEQVRGQPADSRSDIFSFGAILYEMLTGQPAFHRDTAADTISAILTKDPPDVAPRGRPVAPALERIVRHCMEKDPSRRFHSAHDLAFDLETISASATGRGSAAAGWRHPSRVRALSWSAGCLGVAIVALFAWLWVPRGGSIDSIAVLPFVNASQDPGMDYLSDGITESLINSLSQLPHLTVMSRNSVFHFKGRETDAQEAGRDLKVRAVLTGRVMQREDNLSISAELVDVRDNSHLWGGQYNRRSSELLSVQEEIARQISDNLRLKLTGEDRTKLARHPTENIQAYRAYMKGRYFWNQRGAALLKATKSFEEALVEDPQYALAYTGLADSYSLLGFYGYLDPREASPKAMAAVKRALELEDSLGEAHASLGYLHWQYERNCAAAESEFLRAIELAPGYPPAHYWYGALLTFRDQQDRGIAEVEKSIALDPLSPFANAQVGWHWLRWGDYDRAVEGLSKAIELGPDLVIGHLLLAQALILKSRPAKAIDELREVDRISPDDAWARACLVYAYSASGKKDLARNLLKELERDHTASGYRRSVNIALAYTGLGDKDRAFEYLDRAIQEDDPLLSLILKDHLYDPLHADPRWGSFVKKLAIVP